MEWNKMTAAILTGGKSSRMGEDKSRLFYDSRRFLEKLLDECKQAGQIVISVDQIEKYQWIQSDVSYTMTEDALSGFGPVEGIYQSLKASEHEAVFIMAVDMPYLTAPFLQKMASLYQGEDCMILTKNGRWEPLCGIYTKRVLPIIEEMRKTDRRKIGMIYEQCRVRKISLEELGYSEDQVANINTPVDYGRLQNKGREIHRLEEFKEAIKCASAKENVLVCYLDGLGYQMYLEAAARYPLKMTHLFDIRPALTVDPPITNAAMATMLTGLLPKEHGICSHHDRKLSVPTIFSEIEKKAVLLEGDMSIIQTELFPILHASENVDQEIAADVKKAIAKKIPFIFAHFHQIDDKAHQFGPYGEETMKQILLMDQWLEEFVDSFSGKIFLISDHGLSEKGHEGVHGLSEKDGNIQEKLIIWGEALCGQN